MTHIDIRIRVIDTSTKEQGSTVRLMEPIEEDYDIDVMLNLFRRVLVSMGYDSSLVDKELPEREGE